MIYSDQCGLKSRKIYCSCTKCKQKKRDECLHKKELEAAFGAEGSGPLSNVVGIREVFTCLCCGRTFFTLQLALRHVVQQTCINLQIIEYPQLAEPQFLFTHPEYGKKDGTQVDIKRTYFDYQEVFDKCMVKWNDDKSKSAAVELKNHPVLQCKYNLFRILHWTLPISTKGFNTATQAFGLYFEESTVSDSYSMPFLTGMDQKSICLPQMPENFKCDIWLASINGIQINNISDINRILSKGGDNDDDIDDNNDDDNDNIASSRRYKIVIYTGNC